MHNLNKRISESLYLALIAAIIFIPFLGKVHLFDWDEINFAESAREMILTNDYWHVQINFQPFWEKPPFYFWLQVFSMKLFGINEFAARFPNAICGIVTLVTIYNIAIKEGSRSTAIWWVLLVAGSFTPHLYFKSGIIDPWFNYFIFMSIYMLVLASKNAEAQTKQMLFAGIFAGLAMITKGPVAVLIISLCALVYVAFNRFRIFFSIKQFLIAILAFGIISSTWIWAEVSQNGWNVLADFIAYQIDLFRNPVAGHGQPFYYHALVLLLGCFPASFFFIGGLRLQYVSEEQKHFAKWMSILFWVVLVLFSSVTTKIVHYSSLCYLPLTFIAAGFINHHVNIKKSFTVVLQMAILIFGLIIGVVMLAVSFIELWKPILIPLIKDPFAVDSLSIPSPWNGNEFIPGFLFLLVYVFYILISIQGRQTTALRLLLIGASLLIPLYMYMVVPKIEAYSQGPAIAMLKELAEKDVYVETLGHKSYAQYFYAKSKPRPNPDPSWLMSKETDKPVYLLSKTNYWSNHPDSLLIEVKRAGGFVLLKKK
jgi:4-amino-4-deoxy-L-arabinose transferase-like glycosyltransferase